MSKMSHDAFYIARALLCMAVLAVGTRSGFGSGINPKSTVSIDSIVSAADLQLLARAPQIAITTTSLPAAVVGTPYSAAVNVVGGNGKITCVVSAGSLPRGLALDPNTCRLSGVVPLAITTRFIISASDENVPVPGVARLALQLTVQPTLLKWNAATFDSEVVGKAFNKNLAVSGGTPPYFFSVLSGGLTDGVSLTTAGALTGTPLTAEARSATIRVQDSSSSPQTMDTPIIVLTAFPGSAGAGLLSGPYAFIVQEEITAAGSPQIKASTMGSLQADGAGFLLRGELDTTRTDLNPKPNGEPLPFIGSYTIDANRHGTLAITVLNQDGTTGPTRNFTIASSGDESASDSNPSSMDDAGSLMLQSASVTGNGLPAGSYAFGVQGTTTCETNCRATAAAGTPVAAVGQFETMASGTVQSGQADINVGATSYPPLSLTGAFGKSDLFGRIESQIVPSNLPLSSYPTAYVAYRIDDQHMFFAAKNSTSLAIGLAGSAALQDTSGYSNASLNGSLITYENITVDPNVVTMGISSVASGGVPLISRISANGTGTCQTTDVITPETTAYYRIFVSTGGNPAGLSSYLSPLKNIGEAACAISPNGRVALARIISTGAVATDGARIMYLANSGRGYLLERRYAALGKAEFQENESATVSSVSGNYVYASLQSTTKSLALPLSSVVANGEGTINFFNGTTSPATEANYIVSDAAKERFSTVSPGQTFFRTKQNRFIFMNLNPDGSASLTVLKR